jgi:hypothetical protein
VLELYAGKIYIPRSVVVQRLSSCELAIDNATLANSTLANSLQSESALRRYPGWDTAIAVCEYIGVTLFFIGCVFCAWEILLGMILLPLRMCCCRHGSKDDDDSDCDDPPATAKINPVIPPPVLTRVTASKDAISNMQRRSNSVLKAAFKAESGLERSRAARSSKEKRMRRKASELLKQRLAKKGVQRVRKRSQDDSSDSDDGQMPAHSDSVVASVMVVA